MFEDKDYIKNLVNQRDEDQIVIPLYVQIYGKKYSLLELKNIKIRFTKGAFKVGYGTADALFMPNSFPVNRIHDFDIITVFTEYDNEKDRTIRYMVFESGDLELPNVEEHNKLSEEICGYFDMLFSHVKTIVDEHFKALIAEENVPIIPKEKHVEDEIPRHIPIADESDEDIPYPSIDDEYDEYVSSDEALDNLRMEVLEYSQDDSTEITSDLIVEETDNTDTDVTESTSTEYISPPGETNDDYLEESIEFSNDNVDTFEYEVDEVDNEDYLTDFDIF